MSLGFLGLLPPAAAQVPHLIRYQGQATDANGVPLEGPYALTFRLYTADTGGMQLWQETQPNIPLTGGHFSVLLGAVSSLAGMDWSQPRWLSVQLGTAPELAPRQRITSVPLAIRAQTAEQLEGGGDISVRAYNDATISIANDVNTTMTFNTESYDTDTIHSTVTNTGRLTATTAGKYLIGCNVDFNGNATGGRLLFIRLNGTANAYIGGISAAGRVLVNVVGQSMAVTAHYSLAAGEYVECIVRQDSGGALNTNVNVSWPFISPVFWMVKTD
jgi:hypothetical protein